MSGQQLEKTYEPKQVENRWYQHWIDKGYFRADTASGSKPYSIVIPPPNVTGSLHIGHALNNTLQDILIRWHRMQGYNALWVPGMDHAGIATQNVVEKQLAAEGSSREQLGREKFVERVWAWKTKSGGTIIQQLKRLGASCDWSRERFTMDEGLSKAVREVFVKLYKDKDRLLYREDRLINWCPRCLTALSDIEVEHEEITGKLYTIRYPLHDHPEKYLLVATTRPETMLGDAAVAVHPEDNRYRDFRNKLLTLPLTTRTIPVVEDPILVDPEFGTGAVKITPAHDFNDEAAGKRHGLQRRLIMDVHARLDSIKLKTIAHAEDVVVQALGRLPREKARVKIEQLLSERGLLEKVENHKMALGKCYRCKTVVEPYPSTQWFVKIQPLADPAIKAVEDGRIKITPDGWKNNYLGWMRDIKDWCISRQIWWGHRIPAWYCRICTDDELTATFSDEQWRPPRDAQPLVELTKPKQCPKCNNEDLKQDPDVLDTWFSSALWPFSTLGWPEQTPDLKKFYPTSTLVTGLDILFFWVARMIMMGLKFMDNVPPFKEVYIHALVRDAEGQKMSKSKGNVVDPLHVMEQYGTDALRFTLASMASPGRDIKLAEERIEGYRNFANKIWNAARFILMNLDGPRETVPPKDRPFADRWILSRLNRTIQEVNDSLSQFRFDQASSHLYQFIWHDYCDWYLEMIKPSLQTQDSVDAKRTRQTLVDTFETVQRLLHPFMPFISEEIWQALPHHGESIVTQPYPIFQDEWDARNTAEVEWGYLHQFVMTTRTMRALLNYQPGKKIEAFGTAQNEQIFEILQKLQSHLAHLGRATLHLGPAKQWPIKNVLQLPIGGLTVGISVEGDVDLRKVLDRIKKERDEKIKESSRIESKLKNPDFIANAPSEVAEEHKQRLHVFQREHAQLTNSEQQIQSMLS